jgi:multicomponent Na+:H+ antiporter subunit E
MPTKAIKNQILLFILLLAFWLVIVPQFDLVQLVVGAVVAFAITLYSIDTSKAAKPTNLNLGYFLRLTRFIFILLIEIIKANIDVAKIVLSRKMKIKPHFVKIKNPMKTDLNKVIYGNAITLTPGTLTVELEDDFIIIHALTATGADAEEGGVLGREIKKLEVKVNG